MEQPDPASIAAIAARLARARSVLFITGAGISAESGLPTYRGVGGLYSDADTDDGVAIEDALSGEMLLARPELCWKHIGRIEQACRGAKPNRAHEIIAGFERRFERSWVLTQNVDGFHRDAGSRNLIEIHGNVHGLVCMRCAKTETVADYSRLSIPPRCECGGLIRPRVVLFGEMLPHAELRVLERELDRGFDAVFSIGTTSVFPYIAWPVQRARAAGALTVEVNPGDTGVSRIVEHRLRCGAVAAIEAIVAALNGAPVARNQSSPKR